MGIRRQIVDSAINLTSVIITDSVGALLLFIILITGGWRLPTRKRESRILYALIICCIINCAVDAIASICDGTPGVTIRNISMICNTYLFFFNLIVGIGIVTLVVRHIDKKLPKLQLAFFALVALIEIVLLSINFFVPVVFRLTENNVYERHEYYWLFIAVGAILIVYGCSYYFISKLKNPSLRYFPVWQFLMPILIATVTQAFCYGVSLMPIGFAVAFCGLVICLQNECIYIDKLTGVYNRYELEEIKKKLKRSRQERIGALMLDLNGFKEINDNFSHAEGDRALIAFANLLTDSIQTDGVVIRFAGDEFIVIFRNFKEESVDRYRNKILKNIEKYNNHSGKPYKLSAAVGGEVFTNSGRNVSELMNRIDKLMYKDKNEFYKTHEKKR